MSLIKIVSAKTNVFSYGIFRQLEIDLADRLTWQITVNILVIFMFIVSNAQNFINKLISCTVPINFSDNQETYVNEICFIADKYYASDHERILIIKNDSTNLVIDYVDKNNDSQPNLVSYYIFVPYALVLEAILVLVPRYIWIFLLNKYTQLDMGEIFKASAICKDFCNKKFKKIFLKQSKIDCDLNSDENIAYIYYFIKQLEDYFLTKLNNKNTKKSFKLTIYKRRLCLSYLVIKILNIVNIFFLIFVVNQILGIELHAIFYKSIFNFAFNSSARLSETDSDYSHSFYLMNSKYFPFRSTCAFKIRELALTNTYAVTCSLPINLFNQYIFILVLIWYLILFSFNFYYFLQWCFNFQKFNEYIYVRENMYLGMKLFQKRVIDSKCSNKCTFCPNDNELVQKLRCQKCQILIDEFLTKFVDSDSIFLFKIIALNSDDSLIQKLLVYLFKIYYNYNRKTKKKNKK